MIPEILSPLQVYDNSSFLEFYYLGVAGFFGFLIYWYILRAGFVVHIMHPLGNAGKESQEITSEFTDDKGNKTTSVKTISGNAGIYQEIAKKKFSYAHEGQTVNFFATKKQLKIGIDLNSTGKSFLLDNTGVSYIHWRNRHLYMDSESMLPMKLQSGQFNPSSRLWYQLYELGLLVGLHKGASTAPVKQKNSNLTLILIFAAAMAIGYFIGLLYGGTLSPALVHPITSTTILGSSTHSITTSVSTVSTSTSTVIVK